MEGLNLENPLHAYFYGLCIADGHLIEMERGRGRLSIELNSSDDGVLWSLRSLLPWKSGISERFRATNFADHHASTVLRFHGKDLRRQMIAAGFPTADKSSSCAPPKVPYQDLSFWRGVIDGDGSIGRSKGGVSFVSLVTKSDELAAAYCDFVAPIVGYRPKLARNRRDGVRNIMLSNGKAAAALELLYCDEPGISLNRKHQAARKIVKYRGRVPYPLDELLEVEDG